MRNKMPKRIIQILVLFTAVLFAIPIGLIIVTAFKPEGEIVHFQQLLPIEWTLDNFRSLLSSPEEAPIGLWLFNSLLFASTTTLLVLVVTSMAAYALSRMNLPGGKFIFVLVVATLMVPAQILLVPTYLVLDQLGWIDSPLAVVVPPAAGAFGVFLLHQFFKNISPEIEEAAAIDGCSRIKIFTHIILPMSKPALATLGIFTFLASWNDFLGPLVFLESSNNYTLPVGTAMFQSSYYSEYGLTLAASTIATVPALIVFFVFQHWIIRGIAFSGVKE